MSYIVFARKYRPQVFDDIIGQSHITTTLKNAISQDRVAHAYLFSGPRGVGKTTTARIFAKALNCEKGPTPKPCNSCPSCKEITQGSGMDILEIDGASNRGIEEIRNLRENVKFAPSKGRFRVYIIDEVHMLTSEAFNALLKTLEEPPPHAKFIFATTQGYKVPPTILSRCQRFDFRRISTKDILENLKNIAKHEGLNVKDESLILMAKHSDGSMRDAQVMLDQIASFARGKIGLEDVSRILGAVGDDILFGLSGSISAKDPVKALRIIDEVINDGKDAAGVVLALIEHFRNISIAKISKDLERLIDASSENIKQYEAEAKKFTIEEILYAIYTFSNTIDFIRKTALPRIPFEAAMVKLTMKSQAVPLSELMERIEALEKGRKSQAQASDHRPKATVYQAPSVPEAPLPSSSPKAPQAALASETQKATAVQDSGNVNEILSSWAGIINYIRPKKISAASYLQEGYPVSLEGKTLTIGFAKEFQFHKDVLDSPENKKLIEEAIRISIGLELKVVLAMIELADTRRPAKETYSGRDYDDGLADGEDPQKKEEDPIIKAAMDIFDGQIANSRPQKRNG